MEPEWLVWLYRDFVYKVHYTYNEGQSQCIPKSTLNCYSSQISPILNSLRLILLYLRPVSEGTRLFFPVFQSFFFNCMRIIQVLPHSIIILSNDLGTNHCSVMTDLVKPSFTSEGAKIISPLPCVIDGLAGLVECKTKDKRTEVVKSRRANKGSK